MRQHRPESVTFEASHKAPLRSFSSYKAWSSRSKSSTSTETQLLQSARPHSTQSLPSDYAVDICQAVCPVSYLIHDLADLDEGNR